MPSNESHSQAVDILHYLARSAHFIRREFKAELATLNLPFTISGPRLRLLSTVHNAGQIRMNELAAKLGIQARTVTDFVDGLEKENLIIRLPDPTDRRAILVKLTPQAEEHLDKALAKQAEAAELLLQNLNEKQRSELLALLMQLISTSDLTNPSVDHLLS
ncbi:MULTISPECIES: MarR family winged helix-turn-helix transcriptional regulator [unclassified Paenibacillus]|uniref:MarR family winged helix-turn-helix transcriptional regulator n=1 Tax=unclassified Paenibacillus TaxID=185978 RepID=UPI002F3E5A09